MRFLSLPLRNLYLVIGCAVTCCGVSQASGAIRRVPQDYPTIQAAIDASGPNGDTIIIDTGTFTGPGNRDLWVDGKTIEIKSETLIPALCIIDCEGAARGIRFSSYVDRPNNSQFKGITIRNGLAGAAGGGIEVSGFNNNQILIQNCLIEECEAGTFGGGVAVYNDARVTITDCEIQNNTAVTGGGIGIQVAREVLLRICSVHDNSAEEVGGGVAAVGSGLTGLVEITGSDIVDNAAGPPGVGATLPAAGGGIYCDWIERLRLRDSAFYGNQVLIGQNTFLGVGGAVAMSRTQTAEVIDTAFVLNSINPGGSMWGGALYSEDCNLRIINGFFSWNGLLRTEDTSTANGGAIAINTNFFATEPSEIVEEGPPTVMIGTLEMTNCLVEGKFAIGGPLGSAYQGAGLYVNAVPSRISNCTFAYNRAEVAGGGYYQENNPSPAQGTLHHFRNTILWANAAPTGAQMHFAQAASDVTRTSVDYCDVQGGQPGLGGEPSAVL